MTKLPVLIVGGGIGGTIAALALARKEIPSIVLEQAPQFRETGAGIQLLPNVFKMFEYLDITKEMTDIAIFPENLVYIDGINGEEFLKISLREELISRFHYPYGVFHREELLRALIKICQKYPIIQLITGAKVIELKETPSKVSVKTEQGTLFEGQAVIGCDGLWSVVRNYVVGKKDPCVPGHVVYRGVVNRNELPAHLCPFNVVHWLRDNAHLVHYPIGTQGLFNIVAIFQSSQVCDPEDNVGSQKELYEHFKGSRPEILTMLEKVHPLRKWILCDRDPISNWSLGLVTLLGDAAHPTLPYMTQGAGMAIEDACILAQKIIDFEENYQEAFKAYERERYPRTSYVQLMSRELGEEHHASGSARELRNQKSREKTLEENYTWYGKTFKGLEIEKKADIDA